MWSFLFRRFCASHFTRALAAVAVMALLGCAPGPAAELRLEDGWVRAMPAAAPMSAAYGTLHWHGREPLVITAWHSDDYADVSLHRTIVQDGVSRMEAVPAAVIEPGGRLTLEPGGLHLMLMRPGRELRTGDFVGIALESDNGRSFRFDFPVAAR